MFVVVSGSFLDGLRKVYGPFDTFEAADMWLIGDGDAVVLVSPPDDVEDE